MPLLETDNKKEELIVILVCPRCKTEVELMPQENSDGIKTNNPELHRRFGEYKIPEHRRLDGEICHCKGELSLEDHLKIMGIKPRKEKSKPVAGELTTTIGLNGFIVPLQLCAVDNRKLQEA